MTPLYASRNNAEEATERLKVYAQPQRLMILSRLLEGEQTVSEIEAATGITQPALSQQLAELRRSETVATRRAAKQIFYCLANDEIAHCIRSIEAIFGSGKDITKAPALKLMPVGTPAKPSIPDPGGAAAFARIG
jgi:DNA-binding transcriptional ArsR family regulator